MSLKFYMKVPKIKVFTAQPLNYLTTQLLSFFVVAERPCVFVKYYTHYWTTHLTYWIIAT